MHPAVTIAAKGPEPLHDGFPSVGKRIEVVHLEMSRGAADEAAVAIARQDCIPHLGRNRGVPLILLDAAPLSKASGGAIPRALDVPYLDPPGSRAKLLLHGFSGDFEAAVPGVHPG